MALTLGIDIGTTSTIGILIDSDGHTLALAQRPVDLHSDRPGWAEEDPEQWWHNSCAVIPELLAKAGRSPADDRRDRRHRHAACGGPAGCRWPAAPPQHPAERRTRPAARWRSWPPRSTQKRSCAVPATASTSSWSPPSCAGSSAMSRTCSQDRHGVRLVRLHQLAAHRRPRDRAQLGARSPASWTWTAAGSILNWSHSATSSRDSFLPVKASHEVIGEVTAAAASATGLAAGTPVVAGCADHVASRLRCRDQARRRSPDQVRRCRRHPAGDRPAETRSTAVSRLPPGARPVHAERLHGVLGCGAELDRARAGRRHRASGARNRTPVSIVWPQTCRRAPMG